MSSLFIRKPPIIRTNLPVIWNNPSSNDWRISFYKSTNAIVPTGKGQFVIDLSTFKTLVTNVPIGLNSVILPLSRTGPMELFIALYTNDVYGGGLISLK